MLTGIATAVAAIALATPAAAARLDAPPVVTAPAGSAASTCTYQYSYPAKTLWITDVGGDSLVRASSFLNPYNVPEIDVYCGSWWVKAWATKLVVDLGDGNDRLQASGM